MERGQDTVRGALCRACEWMLLVLAIGIGVAAVVVPRVSDATSYVVTTGSMRPTMPPGTLVVVREVGAEQIEPGDVITFMPRPDDPAVVTHRVVGTGFDSTGEPVFQTKGDDNDAPDPAPVRLRQVVGERWYAVPYVGYVTNLLSGPQREAGTFLLAAILLAYMVTMYVGAVRDRLRPPAEVAGA